MTISAIICAAGRGNRAGFLKNKLLVPLHGAPALWWTLRAFASKKICELTSPAFPTLYENGFDEVIVTSSEEDESEIKALCAPFGFKTEIGGATRTQSVFNALKVCKGDIVIIHDGARPYVCEADILGCIDGVKKYKSAVLGAPVVNTIARVCDGAITHVPQRDSLLSVQTPQGFLKSEILPAYEKAIESGEQFTDDSSVYLKYVEPPHFIMSRSENKKLTYAGDFGENLPPLNVNGVKTGFGVDVHAFGKAQSFVTLCGVKIPCDCGLVAHSDGDVALHAVMDALLSAAGLKDIGYFFPDNSALFAGADSLCLLKKTVEEVALRGFCPSGVSVAIQAEKPRLAPYIDKMKEKLAAALHIAESDVGISAGTCEGLGFVGEGHGICVYAQCALDIIRE